jgi:hypothetical protein
VHGDVGVVHEGVDRLSASTSRIEEYTVTVVPRRPSYPAYGAQLAEAAGPSEPLPAHAASTSRGTPMRSARRILRNAA